MKSIVVGIMAALLAASAQTEEAARQLKVARNAELVDGDLHAAIKQYSGIVAKYVKTDRGVTAMALVHMAECYQKLGASESHKVYERVVREFADQHEAAAVATGAAGQEYGAGATDKYAGLEWPQGGQRRKSLSRRPLSVLYRLGQRRSCPA
jgi:lipopolysaccharide biosynthesis regulator YciM